MRKFMLALSMLVIGTMAQAAEKKQPPVQAAEKKQPLHDQLTGQGYGLAGCGLGSVVFGQDPGKIQVIAATLNGISGNQTFGITFGTSNCGDSGKMAKANQFIEINQVALENDIARGSGESLASLSVVMGCQNSDFSTKLRSNWSAGASATAMAQVAANSCKL